MHFSPGAFNHFLGGAVRQDVLWRRAVACPCVAPSSGHADQNCDLCGGVGWAWDEPMPAHTGMQGMRPSMSAAMFGVWEEGDAVLTIPSDSPLYKAGKYDRIRLGDATTPFSVVITPGLNERLQGDIVSIDRVFWIVDDQRVEGGVPEVDERGRMTFTDAPPPDGVSFSVSGVKRAELFLAKDIPNSRNSGVSGLPRKVAVRRYDLLGRTGDHD